MALRRTSIAPPTWIHYGLAADKHSSALLDPYGLAADKHSYALWYAMNRGADWHSFALKDTPAVTDIALLSYSNIRWDGQRKIRGRTDIHRPCVRRTGIAAPNLQEQDIWCIRMAVMEIREET